MNNPNMQHVGLTEVINESFSNCLYRSPFISDQFFDSFLFPSSAEQRTTSTDPNAQGLAYNTVAIQFAPKHLGLVLVSSSLLMSQ